MQPCLLVLALPLLAGGARPDSPNTFRGTLVLREADGSRRSPPRAPLEVWSAGIGGWTRWTTECAEGRFELGLPYRVTRLGVGRITIAGREACSPAAWDPGCPAAPMALTARWTEPFCLRVVDARDGHEIAPLTIVRGEPGRPSDREEFTTREVRRRSPFQVPPWASDPDSAAHFERGWIGPRTHRVWADGMAWASIEVDPSSGGTLALEREALVAVAIEGEPPPRLLVEVRRTPTEPHSHRVPPCPCAESVAVGRPGAGRWFVTAGIASSHGLLAGRGLGIEPVDLRAGERRELRLRLRERAIDARGNEVAPRGPLPR